MRMLRLLLLATLITGCSDGPTAPPDCPVARVDTLWEGELPLLIIEVHVCPGGALERRP